MHEPTAPHPDLVSAAWRTAPSSTRLLDVLEAQGGAVRFVGGCVRDALGGVERAAWDLDLCTSEPPERVLRLLEDAGVRAIPTGLQHGTVTAVLDRQHFEVTTLRRDIATDGRHAVVAFTDDFRADAARRDFTINAMSADRHGRLFDYFGGLDDLAAGDVRFVGDAATRLAEDHLRVLRFFRFHASFGKGPPDVATAAALRAGIGALHQLSGERVWQEMRKLLQAHDPRDALRLMDELDVLGWLLAASPQRSLIDSLVQVEPVPDALRRLAALLRATKGDTGRLAERLRLSNADGERLMALVAVAPLDPESGDEAEVRRALYRHGRHVTEAAGLFALATAGAAIDAGRAWAARLAEVPLPLFPLAGRDVLALGVPPGPEVGVLLDRVERWWLEGGCFAGREILLARLKAAVGGS